MACDPHNIPLGAPLWISTSVPWQDAPWQQLLFAQDVGSAIKGGIRGDIYCGPGHKGADLASALNHRGNLFVLWPQTLAPPRHVW
jgi:membrane-bound lytic murein transglycosylase A